MITNKDIRVENGSLIINGDPYPLDGQSPETIMDIVEDNSDTTPTENSTAPVTSGGVFTALAGKQDTLTFDNTPTQNSNNPVKSGGIYSRIGDNSGTLTERIHLSANGNTSYTVTADSAIMVIHLEGYLAAASDTYEASVQVNDLIIGYLGLREGVACSPTKREQIRIPFRVFKNDVIKVTLSLTGSASGLAALFTT